MLPRGKGNIFFTGATASLRGGVGYAAFASAKFGLRLSHRRSRASWAQRIFTWRIWSSMPVSTPNGYASGGSRRLARMRWTILIC
jgi:NAD(P)-dependent dehydrogenase (short-subunit alcohol dehydrogenase family)